MAEMTPKEIVKYLDEYVVGQKDAKKTIAIALRNRYRRMKLPKEWQDDILPKNILMIGPTGVGKTEIARRMAKMMKVPFVKVEASKYTEVGFVGRDVESMIRDLVNNSMNLVRAEMESQSKEQIEEDIINEITKKLIPPLPKNAPEEKQKEYEGCNVYNMAKLFLDENELVELQNRYKRGGEGHGHFKIYLAEVIWEYFKPYREKREYYLNNQDEVREILKDGAKKASEVAMPMIEQIRSVTGISY